uniref:Uncharacterized protein n=1 Tax=uncultured marine group II/III euryarchaeote AD1000_29_A08 TaxID=1457748 RepID=A0A075FTQ7_9EURY|nr:hypothetical protein [uncultured marine group II/III euryarchaeote AD1000_29_A08]
MPASSWSISESELPAHPARAEAVSSSTMDTDCIFIGGGVQTATFKFRPASLNLDQSAGSHH